MSCPDCLTGGYLPGEPIGTTSIQGAYFSPAPVAENTESPPTKHAILLLTDAFGLPLKNSKIIADDLAKRLKCDVWVPDLFAGYPLMPLDYFKNFPDRAGVKMSYWAMFILIIKMLPRIPAFYASRPAVVDVRLSKFIAAIKEEKKYEKIGAVGYCFGGSLAARFGATDLLQSIVVCHPGKLSVAQANAIKVPAAWVCAESDMAFSEELRLQIEAAFARRKGTDNSVEYEFKVYKGTAHGFAARPNLALPEVKEAYEKAFEQTVEWFQKTITV